MLHGRTPLAPLTAPLFLLAALVAGGCETTPDRFEDPNAVFLDYTEGNSVRWKAARQAEAEQPNSPERVKALQKAVWMRGHLPQFSNYAVDELVEIDEEAAKAFFSDAIVLIADWRTTEHLLNIVVERNWVDFVPALVRSYAKTTPAYTDAERPERKVIEQLRPGEPIDQIVLEVFADADGMEPRQRAAAWQLMYRISEDKQALMRKLMALQSRDPLVVDLQASATDLGILPDNLETVTWLQVLRLDGNFWNKAKVSVGSLRPEQKERMGLRHIAIINYLADVAPEVLKLSRSELLAQAKAHDRAAEHHLKAATFDGGAANYDQRLIDWEDQLTWADLATLAAVRIWMNDRGVVDLWFKQALADEADPSTEYGGLMLPNKNGRAYPKLYKPVTRVNDLRFIAPKVMILDAYTGLAHYHYHAQRLKNRTYAGPGFGDLKFAKRHQFSNIVLTFIDESRLNVDFYQPDGFVVDLGTVRR